MTLFVRLCVCLSASSSFLPDIQYVRTIHKGRRRDDFPNLREDEKDILEVFDDHILSVVPDLFFFLTEFSAD